MADDRRGSSNSGQRNQAGNAERAGQTLDQWGRRAGRFFVAAAARAREEAEDIWAEAQSVRHGEQK